MPSRPQFTSVYAQASLDALSSARVGRWISLGGAFGLAHYDEYRVTKDVDAWWMEGASPRERDAVTAVIEEALGRFGAVRTRRWGEVVSIELRIEEKVVFAFQIAQRSARLAQPTSSAWPGVNLDAFDDLVASKMVALVERGAPRDLLDIFTVCRHQHCTKDRCWQLWHDRQHLAGEDFDRRRAELAIRSHLARVEQARPIDRIDDPKARADAERVRRWFVEEFLGDVHD